MTQRRISLCVIFFIWCYTEKVLSIFEEDKGMIINLIIGLAIGGLAGFVAGKIMNSNTGSILINIILGVVGGFVAGLVFGLLGLGASGYIGTFVVSTVGACGLIYLWKNVLKK